MLLHCNNEVIMLEKRLTKVGNSWAVVLDKPLMDLAGLSPDQPVEIRSNGHGLVITASGGDQDPAFLEAKARVSARHQELFRRLAR
jgi:antitoxin component of MazEF toxin-antitoxin module